MNNMDQTKARGLSSFYSKVYGFLGLGIGISAVTAFLASTIFKEAIFSLLAQNSLVFWGIWIAQLVLVIYLSKATASNNAAKSVGGYIVYSALTGITLSITLQLYDIGTITYAFITSAVTFIVMSVVGVVIKKDLSAIGQALYSLVIGIIIATLLNVFLLKSSPVDFFISLAMVVVFAGLTAYDNQKIKAIYLQAGDQAVTGIAVYCALSLYLDLINLFYAFLRIFSRD
ncbi:Bax inhibitor-1/YccA family protein [Vagococcus vulneris]|uniref:BAX inhibitor (BI)-1/YccA family protein n=1 Tax=Vagococcus vulneris TaxID=1977869 RepID=A0A430A254_9ENTE|nr:Bax inhibitor-1/YccA family protein [Vagococcus vulneris]RSU00526.1 hypothetical protein CBF37_00490 [Vagococcus vulneris]